MKDLPDGPFGTVVADPPWPEKVRRILRPAPGRNLKKLEGSASRYNLMTINEICAMPVGSVCADQSHLYLWCTQRSLRDAFRVMEEWGFDYKATLVWCKNTLGTGFLYFRVSTEFVLFGTKGNLPTTGPRNVRTWFFGKNRGHSVKPEEFFRIVDAASPNPRLELFARRPREGWTVWGDEVDDAS